MPSSTTYYLLTTYNSSTDQSENFLDYRTAIAGVSAASNMGKIDTALNDNATAITALEARKNIVAVAATYDSPNTYLATVSAITAYATDDIIALKLDTDSNGTVTLNINSLGAKSVMKINSSATAINLSGSDMRADREYNCKYDGTRWVWMDATAADQINVNGTAGNFTMINSDNELEDSTVAPADLATTELDNLGTVAINTDLASDTDDTDSLGTATIAWKAFLGYATRLKEKAAATADVAGWGEIWVKSDAPNTLWFTDDDGSDFQLGAGGGLTSVAKTITTGNLTLVEGESHQTTVSGMTADRDIILPTPSEVGVECEIILVTDAPADYEAIVKVNTVELTRLFIDGEVLRFVSTGTAATDWKVNKDGRVAQQCRIEETTAVQTIVKSTVTKVIMDESSFDNAGVGDTTNSRIYSRRASKFTAMFGARYTTLTAATVQFYISDDGGASALAMVSQSASSDTPAFSPAATATLSAGEYIELYTYQDASSDEDIWSTNTPSYLSLMEQLGEL